MSLDVSTLNDESCVIKVHLANHSYNNVRFNEHTNVEKIVSVVVTRFAGPDADLRHYAVRLVHMPKNNIPKEVYWLHRDLTMKQVVCKYLTLHCSSEFRYELRVRYLSKNLEEMYHTQKATFFYFYDQVRNDYLEQVAPTLQRDAVLELGCLEIRRFLKDMTATSLEKKSNIEYLEKDFGLQRFFPKSVLTEYKPKALRKIIQQHFKKYSSLSESDCVFRFLEQLGKVARYDIEIFKCFLGSGWSVPVDIVVGPDLGISYVTDSKCSPMKLADFIHINDIQTQLSPQDSLKSIVTLKVAAALEPLVVTCPTLPVAESLADLVDGYHMLLTQSSNSVWSKKAAWKRVTFQDWYLEKVPSTVVSTATYQSVAKSPLKSSSKMAAKIVSAGGVLIRNNTNDIDDEEGDTDYSAPVDKEYELDRNKITLEELLGEGQFGDVYRGRFEAKDTSVMPVAVKACKLESEESHGENFLEEAYIMQQFDHPHIIKLIGVCSMSPIWIVMELASFGELRSYLIKNRASIELITLLNYCYQLSTALSYLESRKFVHRDIAARNVLVCSPEDVKLSDFGLSRMVEEQSFYTASKGKLPIKWMAPESINFRRFTASSDVWMFAVCIWEIMMYGAKPFQGIRNHDVIHRLESGERLAMPECCPEELYSLLSQMWVYEPSGRPTMHDVKEQLNEIYLYEKENQRYHPSANHEVRTFKPVWNPHASVDRTPPPKPVRILQDRHRSSSTEGASTSNGAVTSSLGRSESPLIRFPGNGSDYTYNAKKKFLPKIEDENVISSSRNQRYLEEQLEKQRKESEEDFKWLQREEINLMPRSPMSTELPAFVDAATSPIISPSPTVSSVCEITVKPALFVAPPDTELCRDDDKVYQKVLSVVRAITVMSKNVQDSERELYIDLVKNVGAELRQLLTTADALLTTFPAHTHSEVSMAQKVLSSNMQKLVEATRLAIQHSNTTLDVEYRRTMLSEAHVLAVECKNFLQAVDSARIQAGVAKFVPKKAPSSGQNVVVMVTNNNATANNGVTVEPIKTATDKHAVIINENKNLDRQQRVAIQTAGSSASDEEILNN